MHLEQFNKQGKKISVGFTGWKLTKYYLPQQILHIFPLILQRNSACCSFWHH